MTRRPLRILFHVTQTSMLRHFESVLLRLAERGHEIRIASAERDRDLPAPQALAAHDRISLVTAPARRGDAWAEPIFQLRSLRDYLRYLEPTFQGTPKLRARALRKMVQAVTRGEQMHLVSRCPRCDARLVDDEVGRMIYGFRKSGVANLAGLFALIEETIPSDPRIEAFLRAERPDVLLVTPLIKIGTHQPEYVKSAKALGIPVGFPVFSWDNLSTKGLVHVQPDRVLVWNEVQRTEAVEMHHVASDRVVVTGAPRFDDFFAMTPEAPRDRFCQDHGLDPAQPIVTYLCSSEFVAGREVEFVRQWIDEIRQAPALRPCNILVRPHPRERKQWKDFAAPPGVAVSLPLSINADHTLFDTVHHSAAVVGLNTSAQLEAGIVGRPVLTVLAPEFADGQQGTLHFQYLLKEHGGFVDLAPGFHTHRQQLAAAVRGDYDPQVIRRFIEQFLRPHGLDRPATPIMADAIEELAGIRETPAARLAPAGS